MEWIILLIVVGVVAFFIIGIYNRLVALRQTTNQAWGDVDVQLKQRQDLVPNLVNTVKGYASHEKETLEKVVQARQAAVSADNVKDQAQAENMLTGALRQIFALSEAYPDLKANENFLSLQNELADLENKIAAARRFFNNAVSEFNTAVEQFPAVLLAGPFGFEKRDFFEVTDRAAVENAPSVSF
ncbi:LemA family protein [Hyphobacterium marinum]|uniref:LemA family protein n=1 Tax=Hyphobacterium marinum TaxID=3116574 RepID=A0ABU7LYU6_9PROT|nr:LemA family protein [Hyphobacterium sp. Y6023]MEE2566703.1 LemA family protein [Hyphobacterium sp. Y6023]